MKTVQILAIVNTFLLVVVLPLLWLYLSERVKSGVREETDKALTDYRHGYDQMMAAITASHQVRVHDLGLFAQRRNEVYAELYSLFEKARGGFAGRFATLTESRDFSHSPAPDLKDLARKLEPISEGERLELNDLLGEGNINDARKLASRLWERASLRGANRAFADFKNSWVLNALYISPEVSGVIAEANQDFAILSVYASELLEDSETLRGNRLMLAEKAQKLEGLAGRLRLAMRAEIFPEEAANAEVTAKLK